MEFLKEPFQSPDAGSSIEQTAAQPGKFFILIRHCANFDKSCMGLIEMKAVKCSSSSALTFLRNLVVQFVPQLNFSSRAIFISDLYTATCLPVCFCGLLINSAPFQAVFPVCT